MVVVGGSKQNTFVIPSWFNPVKFLNAFHLFSLDPPSPWRPSPLWRWQIPLSVELWLGLEVWAKQARSCVTDYGRVRGFVRGWRCGVQGKVVNVSVCVLYWGYWWVIWLALRVFLFVLDHAYNIVLFSSWKPCVGCFSTDHREGSRSLLSCLRRGAWGIFFNESPIASRRHDVQVGGCFAVSQLPRSIIKRLLCAFLHELTSTSWLEAQACNYVCLCTRADIPLA